MLGSVISAGAGLIGGMMNRDSARDAQASNERMAQQNIQLQKEFATNAIQWKVQDAKNAGIHPVYALGAPTTSFQPVNFSAAADTSLGDAISKMGHDIGSAVTKGSTSTQRAGATQRALETLTLQRGALENELLASRIAREKAATPPVPEVGPFAVPQDGKPGERPPLMLGGHRIATNPNSSNVDDIAKRYGDEGPIAELIAPAIVAWQDAKMNVPSVVKSMMEGATNPWNLHPAQLAKALVRYGYSQGTVARGTRYPQVYGRR